MYKIICVICGLLLTMSTMSAYNAKAMADLNDFFFTSKHNGLKNFYIIDHPTKAYAVIIATRGGGVNVTNPGEGGIYQYHTNADTALFFIKLTEEGYYWTWTKPRYIDLISYAPREREVYAHTPKANPMYWRVADEGHRAVFLTQSNVIRINPQYDSWKSWGLTW